MSEKEKSEFSDEELELINQVSKERIEEKIPLREEREKRWRRHKADQLQGYISSNEPFPEWEFYEGFRSLKKADQWLLGWIYYGSAKFLNYLQSFFYQGATNFIETVYNYILFALLFSPLAALAFFLVNSIGFFPALYTIGILIVGLMIGGALILFCLYFLWKILDITIGQTIIGTALVIWFSYLLIN